jgi:hypothetical protein
VSFYVAAYTGIHVGVDRVSTFLLSQKYCETHVQHCRNSYTFRKDLDQTLVSSGSEMEEGQDGKGEEGDRRGEGEERKGMGWQRGKEEGVRGGDMEGEKGERIGGKGMEGAWLGKAAPTG